MKRNNCKQEREVIRKKSIKTASPPEDAVPSKLTLTYISTIHPKLL